MNPSNPPHGPDATARPGPRSLEALLRAEAAAARQLPDDGFTERVMAAVAIEDTRLRWPSVLPLLAVVVAVMVVLVAGLPTPDPAVAVATSNAVDALLRPGLIPWPALAAAAGVALSVLLGLDLPGLAGSAGRD